MVDDNKRCRPASEMPAANVSNVDWTPRIERQLYGVCLINFSAARKLTPVGTRYWSGTGSQFVEIVATQLTVGLLMPMSGIGKAV